MNAETIFSEPSTALVTPAQIDEICGKRDQAIAHWLAAYDTFHEHTAAADRCSFGGVSLPVGSGSSHENTDLARSFVARGEFAKYDRETHREVKRPARDVFAEQIRIAVDRRCWHGLADQIGAESLMDRQAKEEFHNGLRGDNVPEFTTENCVATFGNLWENRREIYLRGIANVFSALDRRFRSHDGFKIGARLIVDRALETEGWSRPHWRDYDRQRTFQDVERVLRELDNSPTGGKSIVGAIDGVSCGELPLVLQGDYFRVRVFKNGNLHIWFERDDLVREVNKLLAEYYGEVIGDSYNETEADDAPQYHVTPAKNFGAFNTSPDVAKLVARYADIAQGTRVLEPSAGTGQLAREARQQGASVHCVEIQHGLAHELAVLHGFADVTQGDFLAQTPARLGQFDVVLMNPPFDRGRDCDHVRHAWQFVKPGGRLIAIMSARAEYGDDARHRALHKIIDGAEPAYGWRGKWHDLPAGSFAHAGTNVNTAVLAIKKPWKA